MRLTPLIDGAPNFRQVPGLPVYGIAIPTVTGLRLVLDKLGSAKGGCRANGPHRDRKRAEGRLLASAAAAACRRTGRSRNKQALGAGPDSFGPTNRCPPLAAGRRRVMWHNMREEPVIYINGRPYVVREADKPFANLEYTGIDRERVEQMEARLKQDVLQEVGGRLLPMGRGAGSGGWQPGRRLALGRLSSPAARCCRCHMRQRTPLPACPAGRALRAPDPGGARGRPVPGGGAVGGGDGR